MIREDCESWLHKHHYELWLEWENKKYSEMINEKNDIIEKLENQIIDMNPIKKDGKEGEE